MHVAVREEHGADTGRVLHHEELRDRPAAVVGDEVCRGDRELIEERREHIGLRLRGEVLLLGHFGVTQPHKQCYRAARLVRNRSRNRA